MHAPSEILTPPSGIVRLPVHKVTPDSLSETTDLVAIESPLAIRLQYGAPGAPQQQDISITMRTPGYDEDLAVGFLYTESILSADVLATVAYTPQATLASPEGDTITISLPPSVTPDLSRSQRHSFTSSSCGVCGKTSLAALAPHTNPINNPDDGTIPADLLYDLPNLLREGQDIFDSTGGLHAAGLFNRQGQIIALREDIGRHNAVDKVIGHALQQHWLPLSDSILLLSGRACFELIQKADVAGIRIVAAVGPPSSLAIRYAEQCGITLIGFLRQQRFNLYAGSHRIRI